MRKSIFYISLLFALILTASCKIQTGIPVSEDDQVIEFRIIQLNDVYEIAPIQNGAYGGMARVAKLIKKHKMQEENTFVILSGDFLNPSLLGTIKHNGKRIKGAQMVDLMNVAGVDLVSFGNHEFDLDEDELQERINESEFDWISTDIFQRCGERLYPFYKEVNGTKEFFPETITWEIVDRDGTSVKLGMFSATVASNPVDYVYYGDYEKRSIAAVDDLEEKTDIIIGITHLGIAQDIDLAGKLQSVPLFIGGHDHENMNHQVGNVSITKADANAKTVYIHYIKHDKKQVMTDIRSELVEINEQTREDKLAASRIDHWMRIQKENLKKIVENPTELIYNGTETWDGREVTIRNKQSNMGAVFTSAMLWASAKNAEAAILNSGAIRIDDQLKAPVVAVDIFRALPFGGKLVDVEISGKLLKDVLDTGEGSKGKGSYLQMNNFRLGKDGWMINNSLIEDEKSYRIVLNDFLLAGMDIPILTRDNPGILSIYEAPAGTNGEDIRKAIINYLLNK